MKFLDYAEVAFVSAKKGQGMRGLFGMIRKAYESAAKRITTGELNRFVESLNWEYHMKILLSDAGLGAPADVPGVHR